MKQLWMLVGGNGAGKSTFYDVALKPLGMPFINADNIARELYPDDPEGNSYNASRLAEVTRYKLLQAGRSFCFETVFSHPSKVDFIAMARALGYQIILVVIHLESSELNKARIARRVEEGGHRVPEDKIESRIPRFLDNVIRAIPLCDEVRVLDNSRLDTPFVPVLTIRAGRQELHRQPLPDWAGAFVDQEACV